MATIAMTLRVAIGTDITAIVFAIFLHRFAQTHDAQAGLAGTFHLVNSRHGSIPSQQEYYNI